jgi:hypothetical protein
MATVDQRGERDLLGREALRVRHWRREQFFELGFSVDDSNALADSSADLEQTRRLVAAGCPLKTAFRIIA